MEALPVGLAAGDLVPHQTNVRARYVLPGERRTASEQLRPWLLSSPTARAQAAISSQGGLIRRVAVSREGEGGLESKQPQGLTWRTRREQDMGYMLLGERRTASEQLRPWLLSRAPPALLAHRQQSHPREA